MLHRFESHARGLSAAALVVLVAAGSGCSKLKARDLLNKGVANFKNGQYDKAVEDFKQAKDLDPGLMNARLYLATAYASQIHSGSAFGRERGARQCGDRRIQGRAGEGCRIT